VSERTAVPGFSVVSGALVHRVLDGAHKDVVRVVEAAYRLHGAGETVNPPSYFLRFPDRPSARIIALPAAVGGEVRTDGLKWVSSFPENVVAGLPRASAVLILNDHDTGYPMACLEGSIISAARTAASAALAADRLCAQRPRPTRIGFFGAGLIARYVHAYLVGTGWHFDDAGVHDLSPGHADAFAEYLHGVDPEPRITVYPTPQELVRAADLIVFATVAGSPHVMDPRWFAHHPLVLHVSLRDLAPAVILDAVNIVDDVDHCLRAGTSLDLTARQAGHREFVAGTLYDVLIGQTRVPANRTVVFSPFGLGVLDVALGRYVYDTAREKDWLSVVDDFFFELRRYG